jgi:hypothetical protein
MKPIASDSKQKYNCPICEDYLWVCENHPDKKWDETSGGCECGAGMPCACNDKNNPAMMPGFTEICSNEDKN